MRNLKKVLTLVLTVAMLLSVMVVGTGAAFSDQSTIKNTEAVDACSALNIIGGFPDGTYRPTNNVTRAEMCKMICVALNGGKEPTLGTNNTPTFTDVRGTSGAWAEAYIESCNSQGIVSGVGGGRFNPNGSITGTQAARMLLVALGYRADIQGYTGDSWAVNVNVDASSKGLYAGVENMDANAALSRDNAAQMIWNAMDAYEVEYVSNLSTDANGTLTSKLTVQDKVVGKTDDKITLLEDKYEAKAITGTLDSVRQDNGKSTYSIRIGNAKCDGAAWTGNSTFTDVATDYSSLLNQNVRVLVKPDKNGKDAVVYGVYATTKNTIQNGTLKQLKMDGSRAKLDGVKYDLAKETFVYVNGDKAVKSGSGSSAEYYTISEWIDKFGDGASDKYTNKAYMQPTAVQLVANDGTTDYSILKVKTYAVGKVTAVGSDYVNVSYKNGDNTILNGSKCEQDDWNWYSDISKNDYVIATDGDNYADGKGLLEKANVVSGKVTGTKSTDSVAVDGNWYTMAGRNVTNGIQNMVARPNTGSNVEMVEVGGFIYFTDTTAGSVDDMALLVAAAPKGGTGSKWEARMIFADGADKTVDIEKYWDDKDNNQYPIIEFSEGNSANPNMTNAKPTGSKGAYAPMLVSYSVSGDVYTLSRVGQKSIDENTEGAIATNGYDTYVTVGLNNNSAITDGSIKNGTYTSSNGADISRLYYESTGVVFVKYKAASGGSDADYKVITGEVAAGYDKVLGGIGAMAVANKSGNSYYAQVGFIDLGTGSTGGGSDHYAIVLDDVVKDTSNGTMYEITAWNGTDEITIKTDDSAVKNLASGALISYSGDLTNADVDVKSSAKDYFVSSYDAGSGDITLLEGTGLTTSNGTTTGTFTSPGSKNKFSKVDSKDTVLLFVSSTDGKGVSGYDHKDIEIQYYFDSDYGTVTNTSGSTWTTTTSEDKTPNVKAYFDDDDQITVLVVDINRNITEW